MRLINFFFDLPHKKGDGSPPLVVPGAHYHQSTLPPARSNPIPSPGGVKSTPTNHPVFLNGGTPFSPDDALSALMRPVTSQHYTPSPAIYNGSHQGPTSTSTSNLSSGLKAMIEQAGRSHIPVNENAMSLRDMLRVTNNFSQMRMDTNVDPNHGLSTQSMQTGAYQPTSQANGFPQTAAYQQPPTQVAHDPSTLQATVKPTTAHDTETQEAIMETSSDEESTESEASNLPHQAKTGDLPSSSESESETDTPHQPAFKFGETNRRIKFKKELIRLGSPKPTGSRVRRVAKHRLNKQPSPSSMKKSPPSWKPPAAFSPVSQADTHQQSNKAPAPTSLRTETQQEDSVEVLEDSSQWTWETFSQEKSADAAQTQDDLQIDTTKSDEFFDALDEIAHSPTPVATSSFFGTPEDSSEGETEDEYDTKPPANSDGEIEEEDDPNSPGNSKEDEDDRKPPAKETDDEVVSVLTYETGRTAEFQRNKNSTGAEAAGTQDDDDKKDEDQEPLPQDEIQPNTQAASRPPQHPTSIVTRSHKKRRRQEPQQEAHPIRRRSPRLHKNKSPRS